MSGLKGGRPAVEYAIAGVGNDRPKANWASRFASIPASSRVWLFRPSRLFRFVSRYFEMLLTVNGDKGEGGVDSIWSLFEIESLQVLLVYKLLEVRRYANRILLRCSRLVFPGFV